LFLWYNLSIAETNFNLVEIKEKQNRKSFSKKRIILSLVFLFFLFVSFNSSSNGVEKIFNFSKVNTAKAEVCYDQSTGVAKSVCGPGDQPAAPGTQVNDPGIPQPDLNGSGSWIMSGFLWVFNILLYAVFRIIGAILIIAGVLFDWAVNAANFKQVMAMGAITKGWQIVRDFLNLFFILVLLFFAFCIIFQISKYNKKSLILTLVIMALLVNFSFPIARFTIDAANIPMYYFLQAISSSAGGNGSSISSAIISNSSGGKDATGIQALILPKINGFSDIGGSSDLTFRLIAAIIFIFLFGVTLLTIAALLVVRILVLAILVIFSPVGFVAAIFPSFSKYSSDWWEQLFKQSFFGTVMAFMLYISLMIMKEAQGNVMSTLTSAVSNATAKQGDAFSSVIVGGVTLAIPIVLLWMAIIVSQKMGAAGANEISGRANKFAKWAGKLPWRGIKTGAKKFERDILAPKGLSPRAFKEGWKARTQDAEDKALKPAAGAWRDRLGSVFSLGKQKTHYKDMEEETLINKEFKEMESYATNDDYLISEIRSNEGKKNARSQAKVAAATRMLYRNNDQNEFMKKFGINGKGGERDPLKTREALAKLFGSTGMNEHQVGRNLYELGEIGLSKGNYGDYGMGTFDKTLNNNKGGYRVSRIVNKKDENGNDVKDENGNVIKYDEQVAASTAKFVNIGSQEKMKNIHWNSILTENKDSSTGGVHEAGRALLNKVTWAEANQVNRARPDFLQRMSGPEARNSLETFIKSDECTNKENVKALLRKIDEFNEAKAKEGTEEKKSEGGGLITGNLREEFDKARSK
jgi:hypothetical protein